jgi:DNA-binding transcriptional LysR family regulator
MRPIDCRKLETFRAVVKAGRLSAASKTLHLSQPALTAQIKALEEECGRPLLVRTSRGVEPNAHGKRLLLAADQMHSVLEEAILDMQGEDRAQSELVIAASMTTASYLVPRLVRGFFAHRGSPVPVRVSVANTEHVFELVADGAVSLGVVEGLGRAPRGVLERYVEDELVAVVAQTATHLHGLRRAEDLCGVPLILREPGSGSRAVVDAALEQALGKGRAKELDLQFGSNQSVKQAAIEGLGVAFLSRFSVELAVLAGKLRVLPLEGVRMARWFSWALPAAEVPGIAGRFLDWARKHPPPPPDRLAG